MNDQILKNMEFLLNKNQKEKEVWKVKAYKKAIHSIKNFSVKITKENLNELKLGKGITEKINTIITTGNDLNILSDSSFDSHSKRMNAINELQKIHNIGEKKAIDLFDKNNISSIEELRDNQHLLNSKQKSGLKYHEDIQKKIPYQEICEHNDFLDSIFKNISNIKFYTIAGSFRRKSLESGDIDVLICLHEQDKTFIKKLIKSLKDYIPTDGKYAEGEKKFMGMCKLNNYDIFRRIDILVTTIEYFPYTLLYFTGNPSFNVEMREFAISKGLKLNEYGLYNENNEKILIEFSNAKTCLDLEMNIFEYLGLQFVLPHDRDSGKILVIE